MRSSIRSSATLTRGVAAKTGVTERADLRQWHRHHYRLPRCRPGDVSLIAPLGTINAGEAGIRVSGNLNLAALFVLNANNFRVAGEVEGLPAKENAISAIKLEGSEASQKAVSDAVKDVTQSRAAHHHSRSARLRGRWQRRVGQPG
jgi:hypothetical protein